jgi:hypothetical protein
VKYHSILFLLSLYPFLYPFPYFSIPLSLSLSTVKGIRKTKERLTEP